eukprot:498177_1
MNDNTFNIANIKFNDDKRTYEWIDYLYYRAISRMTNEIQNTPRNENDAKRTHEWWIHCLYRIAISRMANENQNTPRNENETRSLRIFGETALRNDLVDVQTKHKIADSILG